MVIQEVPGHDNFSNLDFSPPLGSGGYIEIPLEDPEINIPEPGEGDFRPEDDIPPPDPLDPTGGEPEIPAIEPDLPPEIDPGPEPDIPDIPPPEPDIPEPEVPEPEGDPSRDPERDRGDGDPPPPDAPDDDDDAD